MKNIYFKNKFQLLALFALLIGSSISADAQIKKAFTQRTSQYTPTKKIYNVKGDFTMLGNTSLTPQNYSSTTNNNGQFMVYVDKDNDYNTLNSSSSTLVLSNENGAVPSCSNIVYAGLYWTGKSSSNPIFNVTKTKSVSGTVSVNDNMTVAHNQNVNNTDFSLSVGRNNPSSSNRNPIYTFSGNGNTYVFNFYNPSAPNRVTLSVNGNSAVNIPVTISGGNTEATLNTPYTIVNGSVTIKINKLIRSAAMNLSSGDTQDTSYAQVNVTGTVSGSVTITKTFDKRKISLKGPGDAAYTQFTAATNDIYYPSGTDDDIYSAYTEITDFVKNHGIGEYWAADLALLEGNVGGTGYSGGWGIIVVYENSKMKYRDVTIFDGYAYVESSNNNGFTLPVSGFNTVQAGEVGMKLGVMASEGDVDFTGDYFRIQKLATSNYQTLTHANTPGGAVVPGTATNFFNSAINSGGTRNPNLVNNTGIDVSMFNIPNTGNSVIGNNQTATNFKYGTDGDTYSIFAIAMAVDAYIPDVEGSIAAVSVNGVPATVPVQQVLPGQNLVYKVEIRNRGTEPINNFKITIPVPYNATYIPTAVRHIYFPGTPTPNTLTFDPTLGSNGSIVWNLGTLPLPANGNPETLLGDLTFTLKATTDCTLLKNANCNNVVATNGILTGTGAITGIDVIDKSLIQGYTDNGSCTGVAISAPFLVNINAVDYVNQNCQGTPPITSFVFCSPGNNIPITSISGSFPSGSLFYSQFPVTGSATQYTINNPFPATVGTSTYYAVPPNSVSGCFFQFTITVTTITSQPTTTNISYCQNATAAPLTATPSVPGMTLYYYSSINGTPEMSIVPSTAVVGSTTYYVAEGQSATCIGPKKAIVITVYPPATITAPANATVQGCSTAAITGLSYSTTSATITLAQFTAAGGVLPNNANIGTYTLSYIDTVTGTCPKVVTRIFAVATICGNVTATQTITISDTVAPVISALPATSTVSCTSAGSLSFATPTATDNCGAAVTLTSADTTVNGACANSYAVTRTWTATDACGNTATATQTINVNDTVPPVISALPAPMSMACASTLQWTTPTATDSCPGTVTLVSNDVTTPGACANAYTITRTWTATDVCGNTSTASQVINVIDTVAPVISALPAASTIECTATPSWTTPTATDSCSGTVTLVSNDVTTPGACANAYTITRTWTATDVCGNTSTASQVINVIDTVAPVISALPAASTIECTATPSWTTPTATDSCSGTVALVSNDVTTPGACAGSYIVVRTWTATDVCGNSSTASQTINVQDTTAPVISALPAASTIECTATPSWTTPTATDSCSGTVTLVSNDVTTPGACANAYTITRTWTATDVCGNTSTASQVINVIDTVAPVISALPGASTIECTATPSWTTPTATDSCSGTVALVSNDVTTPGACAGSYIVVRTWTATDVCGNSSTASQTINVQDTTAPVISALPAASTIECTATPSWTTPTATDSCSGTVTLVSNDVTTPGACANAYTITRTWTATDVCGNTSTASQVINVIDTVAPVISALPGASTIECTATPSWTTPTATDSCSGTVTLVSNDVTTPGACANAYTITRTWTATDVCGNTSTASQVINVIDTVAPVISALPAASTIECTATPSWTTPTATDSCSGTVALVSNDVTTPGACAGSYIVVRTWTATDVCGNSSTASQTINVQDTTAPVIAGLPAASTISCPASPVFAQATATDACGSAVTLTSNDVTANGACAGSYSVTRTWTATDACGNSSTATQTINVEDTTAPVIATLPALSTVNCPAQPVFAVATAADACGSAFTLVSNDVTTQGACAGSYSVTRTWTATDACGNASTASQTINVQDVTAPVITAEAQNITVQCDGSGNTGAVTAWLDNHGGAAATDACSTVTWTNNFDALSSDCSAAVTVIFTATDACGNASVTSATFAVQDTTAPVAPAAPQTSNVVCASDVPAMISLTATDNCAGTITVQGVDTTTPGSCANSFTITRTWTFTDACGNASNVSQTINVNDNIAPTAPAAPANVTVSCVSEVPAMISLTATDNCNDEITVAGVDSTVAGDCPNSFVTTRTWTFTDACGNASSVSQTITINDTIAPVIAELPAATTINCPASPEFTQAVATDNCAGTVTLVSNDVTTEGACAGSYSVTRTWTATDACGNSSTATQTINVIDNTAPVISALPALSTVNCPAQPVFAVATAVDACGSAFTLVSNDVTTQGTCAGSYSVTRTWTATDACGNASTASQTINVQDVTAPVITAEAQNITVQCDGSGNTGAVTAWLDNHGGAAATDACSTVTWTNNFDALSSDCSAAVTVIFTATDACGNASVTSATFAVQDTTAPVAPAAPQTSNVVCASDVPAMISLTATDNCAGTITVQGVDTTTPGSCANSFTITRTWTFTDACGNASNVSQTINVNDNVAPTAPAAPANVTVSCVSEVPAMISLTATDNCGGEITVQGTDLNSTAVGACANNYSILRTWTFTDACGNSSSVSQTIIVNDTTAPVAPTAPANITASCAGDVPAMVSLTATDNCGEQITVAGIDATVAGDCPNAFVTTRTWTFTDICGNTSSVSQIITINDTTAPVAPAAPADVTATCAGDVPAMISLTASDGCGEQITVAGIDTTVAGACPNSFVTTRTWTFTDACGNTSSTVQTITVNDTVAPIAPDKVPNDITLSCGAEVPANIPLTATDNCGEQITAMGVDTTVAGACANSFVTTRTWTFTDACGNTTTATQVITITDNVAPTFVEATPADISVSCDAIPAAATLTAFDNCDNAAVAVTMTETTTPGDCPNSYTLTRTWSATDACGNIGTTEQDITVQDVTPPTFDVVMPTDIAVSCDAVPTAANVTASDNCGTATVTYNETRADGLCLSSYILTRTWVATDLCGLTTTAVQVITVTDTAGPTIDGAFDSVVNVSCDAIPAVATPTFVDNCSSVGTPTYTEETTNETSTGYTIVRTWDIADACGNASVFTQTVNVTIANNLIEIPGTACNEDISVIDLTALLPQNTPTGGTWVDVNSSGGLTGSNFVGNGLALGTYILQYQITDGTCPRNVNVNMVVNNDCAVEDCTTVLVHNAFSPNGDDKNEWFQIDGINEFDCYPTNSVEIYNRWGVLVYETTQYNNDDVAFKGVSNGRVTVDKGAELPTGTYFYVIKYTGTEGNTKTLSNYLYLSR